MEEKLKGFKTYRHINNPKEEKLHDEFVSRYTPEDMNQIVFGGLVHPSERQIDNILSEREQRIVVSTIQWLGSHSGDKFIRSLGYCEEHEFDQREKNWSQKLACLEDQLSKIPKWIKALYK